MSNELGNLLYDITIKEIIKCCKNKEQKVLANYVLEKIPSTQIFNITDVLFDSITNDFGNGGMDKWVWEKCNIKTTLKGEGRVNMQSSWTPYVDNVFVYAHTHNDMYYVGLFHRLDDEHVVGFFGTVNDDHKLTVFESITIEVNALTGLEINYSHMFESVSKYIKTQGITNPRQIKYLYDAMDICFLGFFSVTLKVFRDLTEKDNKSYKCYIDEIEDKPNYYRSPLDKKVTKAEAKPIILILKNEKDIERKVQKHRSTKGKIHYAFSWVVRGHYRKLHNPNSMGMDRNGVRCMPGVTWIEAYMKGDENLPLLKRERIVKVERGN